jgi:hypothetical protein
MHRCILTVAFVCLLAAAPRATVLVPADLAELSHDARAIARGQVVRVDAQWTEDRRTVETVVTLATEQYLKGDLGGVVRFRVPGGTMGRYRNIVVGAPRFSVGDRVIVFLGANGPRVPYVLGLNQGVYRVVEEGTGLVVTPPPAMPGVLMGPVARGVSARRAAALADFERDVRALVERQR